MKRILLLIVIAGGILAWIYPRSKSRILVFTGTQAYRHASIEAGVAAIEAIGEQLNFESVVTNDARDLAEERLKKFHAVVFLNTSGDVLDNSQEADLERFVQAGGGFVGIHSALQTEETWPWYGELIGARYDGHPSQPSNVQTAFLSVIDKRDVSTSHLPPVWQHTDEWYNLRHVSSDLNVVLAVNESSYMGGTHGEASHPVAWRHEFDGGRVFYTGLGHTSESFGDEAVRKHLDGGIEYALGRRKLPDYNRARTRRIPEENRFTKHALIENLDEPTEMEVLRDGKVLFAQRKGELMLYDPVAGSVSEVGRLDVHTRFEDGLMGLAIDPDFPSNHWIYLYYSPAGDKPKQHLSRFEFVDDRLVPDSEVLLLEVRTQRDECCHTGGSVEFDSRGNLFLSTGDDVNPFASDGYGPIDERPGRAPWDGQGSSGNTNDLRGKILRIHPEPDGSYTIPEGNLFPANDSLARPEIYVMGNRNPYRISIDAKTGFLYWGEVGPDASQDNPLRGPRGYDEVNQARQAGNFGWPYFVGDNQAYRDYDFETGESSGPFDPVAPVNDSPNNTGRRSLPPAQKAFIWYPYADSPEFPIVGNGGRNAMAGPVFYSDLFTPEPGSFPDYFDGKLFIYDWIRGWIRVVTMDAAGNLKKIDPFMPSTRFNNPIDMQFDPNGVLYVLEYGSGWFSRNPDARLSRIEYHAGNRKPVARISADKLQGAAPLTVRFSAAGSQDYDGEALSYTWHMLGNETVHQISQEAAFTYKEPGRYTPVVRVKDAAGNESAARLEIKVGNEPPVVELAVQGNRTFYWDDGRLDYQVRVSDAEDGSIRTGTIPQEDVRVQMDYLAQGFDKTLISQGHQLAGGELGFMVGKRLIEDSDCTSCHAVERKSIGPSYRDVAEKYRDEEGADAYLVEKIIAGGGGVWGEQAMAAHPQLASAEAAQMVEYILSLAGDGMKVRSLPIAGTFSTTLHQEAEQKQGMYFLIAAYTDHGGDIIGPTTGHSLLVLRNPLVEAESYDVGHRVQTEAGSGPAPSYVSEIYEGSYIGFRQIDMTGVNRLVLKAAKEADRFFGGVVDVVIDGPDGMSVGSVPIDFMDSAKGAQEFVVQLSKVNGSHDLYIVVRDTRHTGHPLFKLDWVRFER